MITVAADPHKLFSEKYEEPKHHIEALITASVVTLDIRPRLLYPLWDAGVRTVGDLIRLQYSGVRAVRNIGSEAAAEIEWLLCRLKLHAVEAKEPDLFAYI